MRRRGEHGVGEGEACSTKGDGGKERVGGRQVQRAKETEAKAKWMLMGVSGSVRCNVRLRYSVFSGNKTRHNPSRAL